MFDYTQLLLLGLVGALFVAFHAFMPSLRRSPDMRHKLMAVAGPSGAAAFAVMAIAGGGAVAWIAAGAMLAAGATSAICR